MRVTWAWRAVSQRLDEVPCSELAGVSSEGSHPKHTFRSLLKGNETLRIAASVRRLVAVVVRPDVSPLPSSLCSQDCSETRGVECSSSSS